MQQTHGERWWEGPHAARVLRSCCFLQEDDAQTADLGVPSLYVIYWAAKASLAVNQQGAPPRQCPWGADRSPVLPRSPPHRLADTAAARLREQGDLQGALITSCTDTAPWPHQKLVHVESAQHLAPFCSPTHALMARLVLKALFLTVSLLKYTSPGQTLLISIPQIQAHPSYSIKNSSCKKQMLEVQSHWCSTPGGTGQGQSIRLQLCILRMLKILLTHPLLSQQQQSTRRLLLNQPEGTRQFLGKPFFPLHSPPHHPTTFLPPLLCIEHISFSSSAKTFHFEARTPQTSSSTAEEHQSTAKSVFP